MKKLDMAIGMIASDDEAKRFFRIDADRLRATLGFAVDAPLRHVAHVWIQSKGWISQYQGGIHWGPCFVERSACESYVTFEQRGIRA